MDTVSKMEGYASMRVQGPRDSYGNLGLTISLRTADLNSYNSMSFWTKCVACSSVALSLVDSTGKSRLLYPGDDFGPPTRQFKRLSFNIATPTEASDGFNLQSVASISFLAHSTNGTTMTFWIDDLVVDNAISNPSFVYKGRVLPTDQVEFLFGERIQRPENAASVLPFLSYPPAMDEFAFIATAAIFVSITMGSSIRSVRSRPPKTTNPT